MLEMWQILYFSFLLIVVSSKDLLDEACIDLNTYPVDKPPTSKNIAVTGSGHLLSPGFERNLSYPGEAICSYMLEAPPGMYIRLKFNFMDIPSGDRCEGDNLNIVNYDKESPYFAMTMCRSMLPNDYVSPNNRLRIILMSGYHYGGKGFNITYSVQETPDLCDVVQTECRNRKCVNPDNLCDGKDDCGDGTDEQNCKRPAVVGKCGKPEIDARTDEDRIVGGQEVIPGSWPWMVGLHGKDTFPSGHSCGGTLINSQWVLTAAHCFISKKSPDDWRIHIGSHSKIHTDEYERIRYAERIVVHGFPPEMEGESGQFDPYNDVALIKLNAPVQFSKHIQPACLPDLHLTLNASNRCYATGWGFTRGSGGSDVLKQSPHPVQDASLCNKWINEGFYFKSDTMICAGSLGALQGVCHGDSGGPLVCNINDEWQLVGVANSVPDTNLEVGLCGLKDRPSAFAKVSAKIDWINRMIEKYS